MLLEAVDKEQTTKTECKSFSVKEEKIADNGDSSMQDTVKSLIPNQVFLGMFSNYDKNFLEVTHILICMHLNLI